MAKRHCCWMRRIRSVGEFDETVPSLTRLPWLCFRGGQTYPRRTHHERLRVHRQRRTASRRKKIFRRGHRLSRVQRHGRECNQTLGSWTTCAAVVLWREGRFEVG